MLPKYVKTRNYSSFLRQVRAPGLRAFGSAQPTPLSVMASPPHKADVAAQPLTRHATFLTGVLLSVRVAWPSSCAPLQAVCSDYCSSEPTLAWQPLLLTCTLSRVRWPALSPHLRCTRFRKVPNADLTVDDLPDELCKALLKRAVETAGARHAHHITSARGCSLLQPAQGGSPARYTPPPSPPADQAGTDTSSPQAAVDSGDVFKMREYLTRTSLVRDILSAADVFRHDDFLRRDPSALLRITRRVPQKRQYSATGNRAGVGSAQGRHSPRSPTSAGSVPGMHSAFQGPYAPPPPPSYATPLPHPGSMPPGAAQGFTSFRYVRPPPPGAPGPQSSAGTLSAPVLLPHTSNAASGPTGSWQESVTTHTGYSSAAMAAAGALSGLASGHTSAPRPRYWSPTASDMPSSGTDSTGSPRSGAAGGKAGDFSHLGGSVNSLSPRANLPALQPSGPYAAHPPVLGAHQGGPVQSGMAGAAFFPSMDNSYSPRQGGAMLQTSPRMVPLGASASPRHRPGSTSPRAFMSEPSYSPRLIVGQGGERPGSPGPLPPGTVALLPDYVNAESPRALHVAPTRSGSEGRSTSPRPAAVHAAHGSEFKGAAQPVSL